MIYLLQSHLKGDNMNFEYQASVIVPVYNVEQYLRICLDSLVNQTIDKSKMEVLVINDGSPDNSWDICLEYSKKYDFIKIFSKENEGLSATRNFGIKQAKGKYLFFLDSDDYFTPETVKKVTDFLTRFMMRSTLFRITRFATKKIKFSSLITDSKCSTTKACMIWRNIRILHRLV